MFALSLLRGVYRYWSAGSPKTTAISLQPFKTNIWGLLRLFTLCKGKTLDRLYLFRDPSLYSLCFCRIIETSSWRWKFKHKKSFKSIICLPQPQPAEEDLLCVTAELLFGEKKKPLGFRKYDALDECMGYFFFCLIYCSVCILKTFLFHSWLTFILAITCKGIWLMDPVGIIEVIHNIYFFALKRFWRPSTLFPFAVIYRETHRISALTVLDANSLV